MPFSFIVELPKKNQLIRRFPIFYNQYEVSFEVILLFSVSLSTWVNIIHFTQGGRDSRTLGDHIPVVWYHPKLRHLKICSAVGTNGFHCYETKKKLVPLTRFTHVKISQLLDAKTGKFFYQIRIDRRLEHSVVNANPKTFYDVKQYMSSPWSTSAISLVKHLKVKLSSGGLLNQLYSYFLWF